MTMKLKNEGVYRLVEDPTTEERRDLCVELLKDELKGIVFRYKQFQLGKAREDGTVPYRFSYDILVCPPELEGKEIPQTFNALLGEIILELLTEHYENPNSDSRLLATDEFLGLIRGAPKDDNGEN